MQVDFIESRRTAPFRALDVPAGARTGRALVLTAALTIASCLAPTAASAAGTGGIIGQTALQTGTDACNYKYPYLGWPGKQVTFQQKVTVRYTDKSQTHYIDTSLEPGTYTIGAATLGNVPTPERACMVAVLSEPPLPPQRADTAPETATRPAYNTGLGFFVANGVLYDPSGHKFRIRGVNRLHWDIPSSDVAASGANTERIDIDFGQSAAQNTLLMNQIIARKNVPIPANWTATSSGDVTKLNAVVQTWVNQAATWQKFDRYMIMNIANEWGPEYTTTNPSGWKDAYIAAIAKLRAAGYTSTIAVDTGHWGQDDKQLVANAKAVLDADPQKNVLFSVHVYDLWLPGQAAGRLSALAAVGVPVIVGEFGPGHTVGGMTTPLEVIQAAERNNIGWLAWAWDDYNLPGYKAADDWFALTHSNGIYRSETDLTTFGKTVVLDPAWGLKKLGTKAVAYQ